MCTHACGAYRGWKNPCVSVCVCVHKCVVPTDAGAAPGGLAVSVCTRVPWQACWGQSTIFSVGSRAPGLLAKCLLQASLSGRLGAGKRSQGTVTSPTTLSVREEAPWVPQISISAKSITDNKIRKGSWGVLWQRRTLHGPYSLSEGCVLSRQPSYRCCYLPPPGSVLTALVQWALTPPSCENKRLSLAKDNAT